MKLLTTSAKIEKSQNDNYLNAIMYLDPNYNKEVCKGASKGCKQSCLINSGRMIMPTAKNARLERTKMYFENQELFNTMLIGEIASLLYKANKQGKKLALRLNGTSDLDFSDIYKAFPMVTFYEYTKRPDLAKKLNKLDNVHITFSKHEKHSLDTVKRLVDSGVNVAVVFKSNVPSLFNNIQVINGDTNDRRFEDKKGRIVGLKLKGTKAVKNLAIDTGFAL
jgi:hypothetical protein